MYSACLPGGPWQWWLAGASLTLTAGLSSLGQSPVVLGRLSMLAFSGLFSRFRGSA